MTRRIAAGILALLLLMNLALPAGATEVSDPTVYPIGYKDMWVVGLETVPTEKTEYPGEWRPVYKEDGVTRVSKPGQCPQHACGTGCYDIAGNKTCGVAPEDEHKHNIKCAVEATIKYATYQWQVVDPTGGSTPDETEPQETQPGTPGYDDEELNDGSVSFYVYDEGADGAPLKNITFLLLEEKVEPVPTDPDEEIDPNAPTETVVNQYVKAAGQTNDKGMVLLKNLRLTGETDRATWKLVQDSLEGELGETYKTNTARWDVTIVRNEDGTHTLESVKPEGFVPETDADGNEVEYALYNKETRTLTVINELLLGTIYVDVIFEGFGTTLPDGVSSTVTVTVPNGDPVELTFPMTQARFVHQQGKVSDLKMGTYGITVTPPAEVDGYIAEDYSVQLQCPVDANPVSGDSVTLNRKHSNARVTVTYRYKLDCDHVYTETVVPPTCTKNGYTQFLCECGDSYTVEGELATGHNYTPVTTDPSCTAPGYITYTCSNPGCGDSYVEDGAAAIGHSYESTVVAPSCTEAGYTTYECTRDGCDESYRIDGAAATGHNYSSVVVTNPTCTEAGYTTRTCTNEGCNDSYTDSEVAATGHNYDSGVITPPTCTTKGYTTYTCTNEGCGNSYTDSEVAATGHQYHDEIVKPTCTEKGCTIRTCTITGCGHSEKVDEVAATGHTYGDPIVKAPTCTEGGYSTRTCTVEGCGYSEKFDEVAATGHQYQEEIVKPTCTEKGYTIRTCTVTGCGHSEQIDEVAAAGHTYGDPVVKAPTCTEGGYSTRTCMVEGCGYSEKFDEVAATGHQYQDEIVKPTCTEKGYTIRTCTVAGCGHSEKVDEVAAAGHDLGEWKVTQEASCTKEGSRQKKCTRCDHIETEVVPMIEHQYGDKPTVDADGNKVYTCSVCGNIHKEEPEKPTEKPNEDPTEKPTEKPTEAPTQAPTGGIAVMQSNIIIVRVVDDLGNPLENATIGLYNEKEAIRTWAATYDNVFVLDDLEKLAKDGESVAYTLKQSKAAAGHHLAAETYTVTISNQNGNTKVDVKKNTGKMSNMFNGGGVEMGTDGKQIVTFINQRKTVQIELKCETRVDFQKGSWEDESLIEEYSEKPYQFILSWEDKEGERQEETITVTDEVAILEAELPYGTDYELTALTEDGVSVVKLSEHCEGTVDSKLIRGNIEILATRVYTVEPGVQPVLNMVKVDADTKMPLRGVTFSLKNDQEKILKSYTSNADGEIVIENVFSGAGSYFLEETKTIDGYQLLRTPVQIDVTVTYDEGGTASAPTLVQTMMAEIISDVVVEESDGGFWIENEPILEHSEEEEPKNDSGIGIGGVIAGGVATAVGLGGLGAVLLYRKRKKK